MFEKAIPVWNQETEYKEKLNTHLVFSERTGSLSGCTLKIACADWYKLYINGEFVGAGPARSAVGYARVDEYNLSGFGGENNIIVIYVAGFYCKSLTSVWQNSFFAAELCCGDNVLKYTGRDFECRINERMVKKVERFSVQRYFQEIRDEHKPERGALIQVQPVDGIEFIPRRVPFAYCEYNEYTNCISRGTYTEGEVVQKNAYSFDPFAEPCWGVFDEDEIKNFPFRYIKNADLVCTDTSCEMPLTLREGQWVMTDMGRINAGFITCRGGADEDADIIVAFSEYIDGDVFSFGYINMQSVFEYFIPGGENFNEESFEPHTCRYVAVFVKKGSVTLDSIGIRSFERDTAGVCMPDFKDPSLAKLYNSALRTFAHNAVDIFMDCPSRERAGWLCDSYFTAKAEYFFYGSNPVEDTFLENYILYKNRGEFPEGVLPMVYPSDPHENNKFITQWDMWYVLEVCDYLTNRSPAWDKEVFIPTVYGIVDFLQKYENYMGLLENLPSWNFIEWSSANEWVKDINFPTNILYAGMLDAVATVFDRPELSKKADIIRQKAVELSFDGEVFADNAVKNNDGTYTSEKNVSEACQYYFVLFGKIDIYDEKYATLFRHIKTGFAEFVPGEREYCSINAFIGRYLRMNVLHNLKLCDIIKNDIEEYFSHMCDETSTLWECKLPHGSLDHGFASYVASLL